MIVEKYKIVLPPQQEKMIRSGWGEEILETTTVERLFYESDGLRVSGYAALPTASGGHPCILWLRGGYGDRGLIDEFTARGMFGQLASWGYAVFAPMYRGNRDGEGRDELGGGDVNDALNLKELAREFSEADTSRWGIEGWSRGGYMAYHILRKSTDFKAAVITAAISDLPAFTRINLNFDRFLRLELKLNGEEIEKRSPLAFIDGLPSGAHYLLIHGNRDMVVPATQTIEIAGRFLSKDVDFRLSLLERGDHYLKNHRKEIDRLRKEWFRLYL